MSNFDPSFRAQSLWSTDAAGALGLSSRYTKVQVWSWKRGLAVPEDHSDDISAELGTVCQPGIAAMHTRRTGDILLPLEEVELVRNVQGVRMGSHFDYFNKTRMALHEVKFFGVQRRREFGEDGSGVVPYDVLVQALHEMVVFNAEGTGYGKVDACEVDVVFGNVERAVFVIPYDQEAVDKLIRLEAEFQALVDVGTAPEPTSTEDARRIWAKTNGSEVLADQTTLKAHQALVSVKKQIKALEGQEEELALYLQKHMKEAAILKAPDGGVLATWNGVESERVDVKRFRKELPGVADEYMNKTTSRRFLTKG